MRRISALSERLSCYLERSSSPLQSELSMEEEVKQGHKVKHAS